MGSRVSSAPSEHFRGPQLEGGDPLRTIAHGRLLLLLLPLPLHQNQSNATWVLPDSIDLISGRARCVGAYSLLLLRSCFACIPIWSDRVIVCDLLSPHLCILGCGECGVLFLCSKLVRFTPATREREALYSLFFWLRWYFACIRIRPDRVFGDILVSPLGRERRSGAGANICCDEICISTSLHK